MMSTYETRDAGARIRAAASSKSVPAPVHSASCEWPVASIRTNRDISTS